jgi:hypothetical protein
MCRAALRSALLCVAALALPATGVAGPATRLVILLPGQTLEPGTGLVGTPLDAVQRTRFRAEVYAVDAFGNIDSAYAGPIRGVLTDEAPPIPGYRFGTSISGIGAATSLSSGALRLSLDGSPFQEVALGSPTSGDEVCAAIVAGVESLPWHRWGRRPDLGCFLESYSIRYTLFLPDGTPVGRYRASSVSVDPAFGSAPLLHLGVATPSADPDLAEELSAQVLDPPPAFAERFSRGVAIFEVLHVEPGANRVLAIDQGAGPALPVESSPYGVQPVALAIEQATVLGDGHGAITQVQVVFNHVLDPASLPAPGAAFELVSGPPGSALVVPAQTITLVAEEGLGYPASRLEVGFGSGLPKTDVEDVELHVLPGAGGLQSAETGELFDAVAASWPPLVDRAPPVLVSSFAQDVDGNGGLDLLEVFFSEPVHFSASRGLSLGAFDEEPGTAGPFVATTIPAPSSLRVRSGGAAGIDHELTLLHPDDPGLATIEGGDTIARAITLAARRVDPDPAFAHFSASFDPVSRRYVLRSGTAGATSSVEVLPSGPPDDVAPLLRLGPANGGIERAGRDADTPRLDDFLVISPFGGVNLLDGMSDQDVVADGSRVTVSLSNVPGSGVGTPSFALFPDPSGGGLGDLAGEPNQVAPFNDFGNPPLFAPQRFIRIRDTDSAPDDGVVTRRTGQVSFDATPTVPPLGARNGAGVLSFRWVQVSGPQAVSFADPTAPLTSALISTPGSYVFEVQLEVLPATPPFDAWVRRDGSLSRRFTYVVRRPCGLGFEILPGVAALTWLRGRGRRPTR